MTGRPTIHLPNEVIHSLWRPLRTMIHCKSLLTPHLKGLVKHSVVPHMILVVVNAIFSMLPIVTTGLFCRQFAVKIVVIRLTRALVIDLMFHTDPGRHGRAAGQLITVLNSARDSDRCVAHQETSWPRRVPFDVGVGVYRWRDCKDGGYEGEAKEKATLFILIVDILSVAI